MPGAWELQVARYVSVQSWNPFSSTDHSWFWPTPGSRWHRLGQRSENSGEPLASSLKAVGLPHGVLLAVVSGAAVLRPPKPSPALHAYQSECVATRCFLFLFAVDSLPCFYNRAWQAAAVSDIETLTACPGTNRHGINGCWTPVVLDANLRVDSKCIWRGYGIDPPSDTYHNPTIRAEIHLSPDRLCARGVDQTQPELVIHAGLVLDRGVLDDLSYVSQRLDHQRDGFFTEPSLGIGAGAPGGG